MGWAKDGGSQAPHKRAGQANDWRRRGQVFALVCAVVLGIIPGILLAGRPTQAAPQTTFYGVSDTAMMNAATTATTSTTAAATSAATTAATATNTPTIAATATDTPTVAATATDTPAAATATPTVAPTATATSAPTATSTPAPTPTGIPSDTSVANAATAAGWPQINSNYCGIATVALIADYLNPSAPVSQSYIQGLINDPNSTSEWGQPSWIPGVGPGFTADIAQDFGTDPRSIAYGLTAVMGTQYHAIVDTNGATDTTYHIVRDILTYRQPISVFVDHGQHSVIVSGVDASGDPIANPGSITAIHVWDPGVPNNSAIQKNMEETVPLSTWLSGYTDLWGSDYFKFPYSDNVYQGHPLDPDPGVGPYTFVPSLYNHLWVGHYVYVAPRGYVDAAGTPANTTRASYVSDWEFNQNGALIAGEASSNWPTTPAGYTGATVSMPTNPPPPPPPVQVFTVKPPPPPKPKVVPTPMPKPTPTVTPLPTPRPRRTAMPVGTAIATPIGTPTPTTQGACVLGVCDTSGMAPIWMLSLLGALLIGGVLFTVGAIAPRRRLATLATSGEAGQAAAQAPFTPIPAGPDEQTFPDVHAALRGEHPDGQAD